MMTIIREELRNKSVSRVSTFLKVPAGDSGGPGRALVMRALMQGFRMRTSPYWYQHPLLSLRHYDLGIAWPGQV